MCLVCWNSRLSKRGIYDVGENAYGERGTGGDMEYLGHRLRHEIKYYINDSVYHTLRSRLRTVAGADPNMRDEEGYLISSLYMDDIYHSALEEKAAGIRFRKKYRLRCYNREDGMISLECKRKYGEYISKDSMRLSRGEYDAMLAGDYGFFLSRPETLGREVYALHQTRLLKPAVAVEYLREAYVAEQGNVRITFDKDISASVNEHDMFSERYEVVRALEPGLMVLEVKFDDFLPDAVYQILKTAMTNKCAVSKYVMCRNEKRRVLAR